VYEGKATLSLELKSTNVIPQGDLVPRPRTSTPREQDERFYQRVSMLKGESVLRMLAEKLRAQWSEQMAQAGEAEPARKEGLQRLLGDLRRTVRAVKKSVELGAHAVELHTGRYCGFSRKGGNQKGIAPELERIREAAEAARGLGLRVHAGHGLDYTNVRPLVEWQAEGGAPLIEEFNIGHSIVCRAAIVGLDRAVKEMVSAIAAP